MSKVTALYHIVFCTKERRPTIPLEYSEDLYRFIWKESTSLNCKLLRIGGIQNHVHILIDLHPSIALSAYVKAVKSHSSGWMQSDSRFPDFICWAAEYYAFTISPKQKNAVIEYIKNQRTHHLNFQIENELTELCRFGEKEYDDRDLR